MQLILHYLKRYKKLFVLNIISVFGFALVELGIPTIVSEMIDNGIMNQDKQYLIRMGIVIAVISLIGVSGTILLDSTLQKSNICLETMFDFYIFL